MSSSSVTAELLEQARAGDRGALDALVARFEVPLRTYLRRRLSRAAIDAGTADDLFQEVVLEAFRALPGFAYRHDGSYLAWLYTIARRCLAREYARGKQAPVLLALGVPGTTTDQLISSLVAPQVGPDRQVERAQQLDVIAQGLAELPDDRRDAIMLCYFEGCDGAEAARRLGLTHDAFRQLLSRSRRQLAEVLDRLLGGDGALTARS